MSRDIFMESQSCDFLFPDDQKPQHFQPDHFFQHKNHNDSKILPAQCSTVVQSMLLKDKESASQIGSSKKIINSAAGKQARERKKKYLQNLEVSVQELQIQVKKYEAEIQKTKETLAQTLNTTKNVKIQKIKNQNSITYSELQLCIESQDPNEDKINLLLDMIKFRIGASGHERQAKIEYYFKQLVNTLFPAIHRYLMYCSDNKLDLFEEQSIDQFFGSQHAKEPNNNCLSWTGQFLTSLEITQKQRQNLLKLTPKYINKKLQVSKIISSLKEVKDSIKMEEEVFENMIDQLRSGLRPVQAAAMVLFSDKSKYKRQLALEKEGEFDLSERNQEEIPVPTKKIKLE